MCDTASTTQAAELKGEFDHSYLAKQGSVSVEELDWIKQVCVSKDFVLLLFVTETLTNHCLGYLSFQQTLSSSLQVKCLKNPSIISENRCIEIILLLHFVIHSCCMQYFY